MERLMKKQLPWLETSNKESMMPMNTPKLSTIERLWLSTKMLPIILPSSKCRKISSLSTISGQLSKSGERVTIPGSTIHLMKSILSKSKMSLIMPTRLCLKSSDHSETKNCLKFSKLLRALRILQKSSSHKYQLLLLSELRE